ncbi:MAG TPA: hypothetical protein PKG88_06900 [Bacteroidales bacterium]|nr:hypothetical protein [Bacteroidales bacterium]HPS72213.1 hypothetical protein [Bacteroidales bacterium]
MKIKFLFLLNLMSILSVNYANDTLKFNNIFDLSCSYYDFSYFQNKDNFKFTQYKSDMIVFGLDYNYKILNFLSFGGYGKIGRYNENISENIYIDSTNSSEIIVLTNGSRSCWHYGINSKIFLIPLFFNKNIPRFDIYVAGSIGLISDFSSHAVPIFNNNEHFVDFSTSVGISFYIFKHLGVFSNYEYSKNKYYKGFNWKFGLNYRF